MKAITKLVLFIALVSLSACTVETTGPGPDAVEPTITRGTVETDYRATLEGENAPQFVICNDETTRLTYSFTYSGDLSRWNSYLEGRTTQEVKGEESFTLSSDNIRREGNTVTVVYNIPAGTAPRLVGENIDTQGIVVVPNPRELGETQLFLEVEGFTGLEPTLLSANPVPVIENCPEQVEDGTNLTLTDIDYTSEFETDIGNGDELVICNDRDTEFSYSFTYRGNLETWESYFEGEESGTTNGNANLNLNSPGVTFDGNRVTVRYTLRPNSAPTLTGPELDPQAIVINPTVEGETALTIVVDDDGTEREFTSDPIPVMSQCENQTAEAAEITSSSYRSDFTTTIDGESRGVICNDRVSTGDVTINYEGDLETLELFYRGVESGDETGVVTYDETQIRANSFAIGFRFAPNQAPQFIAGGEPGLSTQGIVITPDILGETQFFVRPNGQEEFEALDFEIPVAATCE